jgi:hypothetical protein
MSTETNSNLSTGDVAVISKYLNESEPHIKLYDVTSKSLRNFFEFVDSKSDDVTEESQNQLSIILEENQKSIENMCTGYGVNLEKVMKEQTKLARYNLLKEIGLKDDEMDLSMEPFDMEDFRKMIFLRNTSKNCFWITLDKSQGMNLGAGQIENINMSYDNKGFAEVSYKVDGESKSITCYPGKVYDLA